MITTVILCLLLKLSLSCETQLNNYHDDYFFVTKTAAIVPHLISSNVNTHLAIRLAQVQMGTETATRDRLPHITHGANAYHRSVI